MKKIVPVFIVVIALIGCAMLAKNSIAKASIEKAAHIMTGLPLQIGSLDVGILNSRVSAKNLKLGNPPNFSDPVMASLPELYVDYDFKALLKKQVHLEELRIDLQELDIIKNK